MEEWVRVYGWVWVLGQGGYVSAWIVDSEFMRAFEISGLWNPSVQHDRSNDVIEAEEPLVQNEYVSFPINPSSVDPNAESYTPSPDEVKELYCEVYKDLELNSRIQLPRSVDDLMNTDQIVAATRYYFDQISPNQSHSTPPFELLQLLGFPLLYTAQYYTYGAQQQNGWAYTVDVLYWLKQTRDFMLANAKVFANESTEGITDMQSYLEYTELGAYIAIKKGGNSGGGDAIIAEIRDVLASCANASSSSSSSGSQSERNDNDRNRERLERRERRESRESDSSVDTDEINNEIDELVLSRQPSQPTATEGEIAQYNELETAAKSLRTRLQSQKSEHSQLITVLAISADLPSQRVKELLTELPKLQKTVNELSPTKPDIYSAELESILSSLDSNLAGVTNLHLINTPAHELSEKLSEVKNTVNNALSNSKLEESEFQTKLSECIASKQSLETELTKLRGVENVDIAVLTSQLITIKSETVQLQSEIASLEHRRRGYDEKKASEIREEERKQTKLEQLQTEAETLKRKCDMKQKTVQSLLPRKVECESLFAAHQELSQALSSASARITAANSAIAKFCAQDEKRIAACKALFISEHSESVNSILRPEGEHR